MEPDGFSLAGISRRRRVRSSSTHHAHRPHGVRRTILPARRRILGTMTTMDDARLDLWKKARRILCVRLDSLGDVLMTSPAVNALKQSEPNRSVTLLTSPSGAQAGRLMPCVDEVGVYEAPWIKGYRAGESAAEDRELIT